MLLYNMIGNFRAFALRTVVNTPTPVAACSFLAEETGLSVTRVKDAMNKGAAWIHKKGRMARLRKAKALLHPGTRLEFHYDEALLGIQPPDAALIRDLRDYSVWFKPAGLMSQGTMYGDHCSLLRQTELFYGSSRPVYLVHRLDREASGIMLIAHSRQAASLLSGLFREGKIFKGYRVQVRGDLLRWKKEGSITHDLDGKKAATDFTFLTYNPDSDTSVIEAVLRTGRLHQIRRHFAMAGYPVMGDPRYGKNNKNTEGLRLVAVSLKFISPFSNKVEEYRLPEDSLPF